MSPICSNGLGDFLTQIIQEKKHMDMDSLIKGTGILITVLNQLKQIASLLPNNSDKSELLEKLEIAMRELKKAEAETATSLGYEICRAHFPPGVMLSKDNKNWECPDCHNITTTGDYGDLLSINR